MNDQLIEKAIHMRENAIAPYSKYKVGSAVLTDSGKIFGAITTLMVSDLLRDKGFTVDRKQISFPVQPKEAGEFKAELALHKEVSAEVTFNVVSQ